MTRYIITLLILLASAMPGFGAEPADTLTAAYVLTDLKAPEMELLSRATRLDMADFARAGRRYTARNEMNGEAELDTLTANYASLTLSEVSSLEIKTLPARGGGIAFVSYTIDSDGADSELFAYDRALRPLPVGKYFKMPTLREFMLPSLRGDKHAVARLEALTPFFCTRLCFSPYDAQLRAELSLESVVGIEDWAKIQPMLMAPAVLSYRWDGSRFTPVRP